MFHPFRFLWKQFSGPQITAIMQSVYNYIVRMFDKLLDYYNNLSIATANSAHLTVMGMISGLLRPIIEVSDVSAFFFTDGEHNYEQGFGDLDKLQTIPGGRFIDLDATYNSHKELMPTELYRSLLLDYVNDDGEIGSLKLLDNFMYNIWKAYRKDPPNYHIEIVEDVKVNSRYGDIWIYLGPTSDWGPFINYVSSILSSLNGHIYAPEPRIYPTYTYYTPNGEEE